LGVIKSEVKNSWAAVSLATNIAAFAKDVGSVYLPIVYLIFGSFCWVAKETAAQPTVLHLYY
jgi:hypothetical protein